MLAHVSAGMPMTASQLLKYRNNLEDNYYLPPYPFFFLLSIKSLAKLEVAAMRLDDYRENKG